MCYQKLSFSISIMKSKVLLFILLTTHAFAFSQSVTYQYYDKNWATTDEQKADYIRQISTINDTLYRITETDTSGEVLMTGEYYSLNPKVENGTFIFSTKLCGFDTVTGQYRQGDMVGKWSYKDADAEPLIIDYDFTLKNCFNIEEGQTDENSIYVFADKMPTFKGGDINSCRVYINKTLHYPPMEAYRRITGLIFVTFVVNTAGEVCDISITRSSMNKHLDREALRAVSESPEWEPGSMKGKKVNVRFSLPFRFPPR